MKKTINFKNFTNLNLYNKIRDDRVKQKNVKNGNFPHEVRISVMLKKWKIPMEVNRLEL